MTDRAKRCWFWAHRWGPWKVMRLTAYLNERLAGAAPGTVIPIPFLTDWKKRVCQKCLTTKERCI